MIHISLEGKEPDKEWLDKAKELTEKLKKATSDERKEIIENNQKMWRDLKKWLSELSHGKCWYSEAKEIYSIYDVDHFRPKNSVVNRDGTTREGYWWLAFDWRNYRLSGTVGNRPLKDTSGKTRGKWDYFPLHSMSSIATYPEDDLMDEIYYLLDPTDSGDPSLISFDESGLPVAINEEDSWVSERVRVTIDLLHLDYLPLVEARRKIWMDCRDKIDEIKKTMSAINNSMSVNRNLTIRARMKELQEMVSSSSPLAGTARACLLKSGIGWAQNIVANAK